MAACQNSGDKVYVQTGPKLIRATSSSLFDTFYMQTGRVIQQTCAQNMLAL